MAYVSENKRRINVAAVAGIAHKLSEISINGMKRGNNHQWRNLKRSIIEGVMVAAA